jgi:hypothetical protein
MKTKKKIIGYAQAEYKQKAVKLNESVYTWIISAKMRTESLESTVLGEE